MLRAITCAATVFFATTSLSAQDVRSTVGPLEQSAKPSSPENPIPRRTSAPQARQLDDWRRVPGGRGGVQFQVTLDTSGQIGEIRHVGDPFVFTAGASVDEKTRRAIADGMIKSAADALRRWKYDPPAAPIKFVVVFAFGAASEPSAVQRDEAPARARGPASVAPPPRQIENWPAAEGALRVGGNVRPPRQTKSVRPDFPREAQERRVGGVVVLEALIGPDGKVKDVRVVRSSPLLDRAAMDAVRKWEYEPPLVDGTAVPVVMTITVSFSIN
jgi:TonB family protein